MLDFIILCVNLVYYCVISLSAYVLHFVDIVMYIATVTFLEYCRYGVEPKTNNQSMYFTVFTECLTKGTMSAPDVY